MTFVSVQIFAIDLPAPIKSAAEARHTNASNRVYSTKSWPSSSRTKRDINCIMGLVFLQFNLVIPEDPGFDRSDLGTTPTDSTASCGENLLHPRSRQRS